MISYEIAVHLSVMKSSRRLKALVTKVGLKHKTTVAAKKAARILSNDPEIEWVNVSKVELRSIAQFRKA